MGDEPLGWDPDELELNKAVYLSVYGRDSDTGKPLTQEKVAERLGTSREQVNRYLQSARRQGLLRTDYVPPSEAMLDRVILDLNYTDVAKILRDFAELHQEMNEGRVIQSVTVVCEELPCNRKGSWDESLLRFAPLTAAKTKQFIRDVAKCTPAILGVAWGRSLRCVIDQVSSNDIRAPRREGSIQCVPLWGEPWGPEVPQWKGDLFIDRDRLSSTVLAGDLEDKLNRSKKRRQRYSLQAVPVMLPRELAEHNEVLFEYLRKVSAWGAIFGGQGASTMGAPARGKTTPLAEQLKLVLAAAGSAEKPGRFLAPEVLKNTLTEKDAARLLRLVYGDVAGVLMEKPGLSRSDRAFLDGIHTSWTGVNEEHLRGCAARARDGEAVGVVAYAIDRSRAKPILEVIRRGLLTHLVTEMGLAVELKRLAQQTIRRAAKGN